MGRQTGSQAERKTSKPNRSIKFCALIDGQTDTNTRIKYTGKLNEELTD